MIYEVKSSRCCCLESELLLGLDQDIGFISAVKGTNSFFLLQGPVWVCLSSLDNVFAVTPHPACSEQVLQGMRQGIEHLAELRAVKGSRSHGPNCREAPAPSPPFASLWFWVNFSHLRERESTGYACRRGKWLKL